MNKETLFALSMAMAMAMAGAAPVLAQSLAPVAATEAEASTPRAFTSAAQARIYLAQNPTGIRAEQAFRATVDADLAARNPELDAAAIASGSALKIVPGATATPEAIEAIINATTSGIGARTGWF